MQFLTTGEKEIIETIEKISPVGFETVIRVVYIATRRYNTKFFQVLRFNQ